MVTISCHFRKKCSQECALLNSKTTFNILCLKQYTTQQTVMKQTIKINIQNTYITILPVIS